MNDAWGAIDSRQQLPVAAVALAADARRKAVAERIESIKAVNTAGDDAVIVFDLFVGVLGSAMRWWRLAVVSGRRTRGSALLA